MDKIKVSIIVSIYNSSLFLKKCLDTYTNQTLKEIEIILVNDGSTDNSEEICQEYLSDNRVNYFYQKNKGKSAGVNFGYKKAKGKYILILDSDDYIDFNLCEKTYNLAEKFNLDIVNYSYYYVENNSKTKKIPVFPKNTVLYNDDIKSIIKKNTYNSKILWFTWTNLFRKELLDKNKILHNENLKIGVDSTFNLECYLSAEKMYSINDAFYYYVNNPDSLTQVKFKIDLPNKLENQFINKLNLYNKLGLTDIDSKIDFSRYYLQHSLFFILKNELNNVDGGIKTKNLKKIKALNVFKYSFQYYKPSKDCPLRKKIIIWSFKNNLFLLIILLLKL